jgi:hypothetical protein
MSLATWGVHDFHVDFDSKSLKSNVVAFENNIPTTYQAPKLELFDLSIRSAQKMNWQFDSQLFNLPQLVFQISQLKMLPHFK